MFNFHLKVSCPNLNLYRPCLKIYVNSWKICPVGLKTRSTWNTEAQLETI